MFKKTVSLTSFIAFICAAFTSIVLYLAPHGHVAFWTDWTFLTLHKGQWADIHITIGVFFCITLLLHASLNIGALLAAIQNKRREFVLITVPMVLSCMLVATVVAGTVLHMQPMQAILDFSTSLKEEKTRMRGTPPYGRAELSTLHAFCQTMGYNMEESIEALKKAGYTEQLIPSAQLMEIAHANGISPQHIYLALKKEFPEKLPQMATTQGEAEGSITLTPQSPAQISQHTILNQHFSAKCGAKQGTDHKKPAKQGAAKPSFFAALHGKQH